MSGAGQLAFPGLEPEPQRAPTDRLFFGLFPDATAAGRIAGLADRLRAEHRLAGRPLQADRLHVTVSHVDDFAGLPDRVVAAARDAGASVRAAPFDIAFDRVASFANRRDKKPFVLRGGDGLAPLIAFQQALSLAMAKAGLGRYVETRFTPHVTLLYDAALVPEQPVEPIRWTVRELVLVHSLLGQTRHVALGRWPLG
jgi:2'-5' RNA ligase